jgi:exosortase A-associated hydrolase 1
MIKQQLAPPKVIPLTIDGQRSLGIFVAGQGDIAVLMVNGGAQIRAGSHRMQQQLASFLQQQQISSFRFDFPGFGDAEGQPKDFIQHAHWLSQVLNTAQQAEPQVKHWVFFGLCDGASAILLNQQVLQQAAGLILLNPWCRAEQNHAKTMVRFYYWQRLCSAEFWKKLLSGQSKPLQSLQQFFQIWRQARTGNRTPTTDKTTRRTPGQPRPEQLTPDQYVTALLEHWRHFQQPVLLVLSEKDLTAQECASMLANLPSSQRQQIAKHTTTSTLSGANHTCSEAEHFKQLQLSIGDWFRQNFPA